MLITMLVTFVVTLPILIVWDPLKFRQDPKTPLARTIAWVRAWLVDDVRRRWRRWSMRLNAIGLAILSLVQIEPGAALYIWSLMPDPVQLLLPTDFLRIIGLALFGLAMLAVFVKQPGLDKRDDR